MNFPDIVPELKARIPNLCGRLLANQPLGEFTWFRVGGPAQAFFMPEDDNDLAYVLRNLPVEVPVTAIGAGSNMIVRDGGGLRTWRFDELAHALPCHHGHSYGLMLVGNDGKREFLDCLTFRRGDRLGEVIGRHMKPHAT